jgi:hypothetical protein
MKRNILVWTTPEMNHLAQIVDLVSRNEARIAQLTTELEELLVLLAREQRPPPVVELSGRAEPEPEAEGS